MTYYRKDIDELERVQRRQAKRIIHWLRNLPHEEKYEEIDSFNLANRRIEGDLTSVVEIFKYFETIAAEDYLTIDHSYKQNRKETVLR